jgi:hypothetical protein
VGGPIIIIQKISQMKKKRVFLGGCVKKVGSKLLDHSDGDDF